MTSPVNSSNSNTGFAASSTLGTVSSAEDPETSSEEETLSSSENDSSKMKLMSMKLKMMELRLKLKEKEIEAAKIRADAEFQLRIKDEKLIKIATEQKTNVYEVQLKDIQSQEVGLNEKIIDLQKQVAEAYREHAAFASFSLTPMHPTYVESRRAASKYQSLSEALQSWMQKKDSFAAQRQEIYKKMEAS